MAEMKRKGSDDRGAAEVKHEFTCVRIRFADLRFQLGCKMAPFHRTNITYTLQRSHDLSVRGNTDVEYTVDSSQSSGKVFV
jgi:hypothetical protein